MSADRVPSRAEVMGWSPQQLADYLKRMSLSGCDKAVMRNSINGARFVNLSDNDLQKFPKLHAPMISKLRIEISKKEEKRGLFGKKVTPKYHEPVVDPQGWGEDEFDDEEFDDDYESPYSGDEDGSGGDYESPNDGEDCSNDYEPPPSEPQEDPKLCPSMPLGDSEYIDNQRSRGLPPAVCPRPTVSSLSAPSPRMPGESSSRRDHSPHIGARPPTKAPPGPPQIFRGNKPGRDPAPNSSPVRGPARNTMEKSWRPPLDTPEPPTWSKPPVLPPPTTVGRSNSSVRPPPNRVERRESPHQAHDDGFNKHNTFPLQKGNLPPRPGLPSRHGDSLPPSIPSSDSLPHKLQSALADHRSSVTRSDRSPFRAPPPAAAQELDPYWYVGRVTRGQAEGCLKRVNKDGAYLVRDSTRQQPNQPFTLMVFYQDKVYNIQIRQQNQNFLLGTGLKVQESFPSVNDIIGHYSQSPLLLIDAKNRSASQQNQCLLSDPAGYYMSGHH